VENYCLHDLEPHSNNEALISTRKKALTLFLISYLLFNNEQGVLY
jgi:hypothetical protein